MLNKQNRAEFKEIFENERKKIEKLLEQEDLDVLPLILNPLSILNFNFILRYY